MPDYQSQLEEILDFSAHKLSDVLPSVWAEQNFKITKGKFPGPLSYDRTPFSREIIDCMSPYHYATEIMLLGGAKWGKTSSVIEPALAYYISEHPCDMGYLTGHSDLSDESMAKLDSAIDNAGLRPLIRKQSLRKGNKTGDTNKMKEFPYGSLVSGSATNHKLLRQRDWKVIIPDDIEAANNSSKKSGSTVAMIRERAKSFGDDKKILWVSTPELEEGSIIMPLYLSGDQREWHWPCPRCDAKIVLKWSVPIEGTDEKAGFVWKTDNGRLRPRSVEYVCQSCGKAFDESRKYELNLAGVWIPGAVPFSPTFVSFKLPSLYATPGMNGWDQAVRDFLAANPEGGQPRDEELMKVFVNLTLAETYKPDAEAPKANAIQKNCRKYRPCNVTKIREIKTASGLVAGSVCEGDVPEQLSIRDGNGPIILILLTADLNGIMKEDNQDVRLDYEIKAFSAAGPTYALGHGSIGTFQRGIGKEEADGNSQRRKWTYEENKPNSVWPEFEKVLATRFQTDTPSKDSPTGFRRMAIQLAGLDVGNFTNYAYAFLDNTEFPIVGLKGEKEEKLIAETIDAAIFKHGIERKQDYILKVGLIKDKLSNYMSLTWNPADESQPTNFLNYPEQGWEGMYTFDNYFSHFESEEKKLVKNKDTSMSYRWEKKNAAVKNHMWDTSVYLVALREIVVHQYASLAPELKHSQWRDYVAHVLSSRK